MENGTYLIDFTQLKKSSKISGFWHTFHFSCLYREQQAGVLQKNYRGVRMIMLQGKIIQNCGQYWEPLGNFIKNKGTELAYGSIISFQVITDWVT